MDTLGELTEWIQRTEDRLSRLESMYHFKKLPENASVYSIGCDPYSKEEIDSQTQADTLPTTTRVYVCLRRGEIKTAGELYESSYLQLMGIRNFGTASMLDIQQLWRNLGASIPKIQLVPMSRHRSCVLQIGEERVKLLAFDSGEERNRS